MGKQIVTHNVVLSSAETYYVSRLFLTTCIPRFVKYHRMFRVSSPIAYTTAPTTTHQPFTSIKVNIVQKFNFTASVQTGCRLECASLRI